MQIPVMRRPGETSALNTTAGRWCYKLPCKSQAAPQCVIIIRVIVTHPMLFFFFLLQTSQSDKHWKEALSGHSEGRREQERVNGVRWMWAESPSHIGQSVNLSDSYYIKRPIRLLSFFAQRQNKQEIMWSLVEVGRGIISQLVRSADLEPIGENDCLCVKQNEVNDGA